MDNIRTKFTTVQASWLRAEKQYLLDEISSLISFAARFSFPHVVFDTIKDAYYAVARSENANLLQWSEDPVTLFILKSEGIDATGFFVAFNSEGTEKASGIERNHRFYPVERALIDGGLPYISLLSSTFTRPYQGLAIKYLSCLALFYLEESRRDGRFNFKRALNGIGIARAVMPSDGLERLLAEISEESIDQVFLKY